MSVLGQRTVKKERKKACGLRRVVKTVSSHTDLNGSGEVINILRSLQFYVSKNGNKLLTLKISR